jgi:hypothetical protein
MIYVCRECKRDYMHRPPYDFEREIRIGLCLLCRAAFLARHLWRESLAAFDSVMGRFSDWMDRHIVRMSVTAVAILYLLVMAHALRPMVQQKWTSYKTARLWKK